MEIKELDIKGAWIAHSPIHKDDRGLFREWFRADQFEEAIGYTFKVQQSNISSSNKGVIRGIHYSRATGGQGKWVTCVAGSIWDVVIDIRPSSPTFKKWTAIELNAERGDALYISEGLGHGFVALENNSTIVYLLTSRYSPAEEYEINPFDLDLKIEWPLKNVILSNKDSAAPSLKKQFESGKL
jgi:dTDP-4-dehydrorhamnose 3,5-epimerase